MNNKPLIIFGNGGLAETLAQFCVNRNIITSAFTVDAPYRKENHFKGLPNIDFDDIEDFFPPSHNQIFIAIGASDLLGNLRKKKMMEAESKGYDLFTGNFADGVMPGTVMLGKNTLIMPNSVIDPFTEFGDGVIVWGGAVVAHHTRIGDYSFLAPASVLCGKITVAQHCFIGANATIRDNLYIAECTVIGAGAVITHDTEPNCVYLPSRATKLDKHSSEMGL